MTVKVIVTDMDGTFLDDAKAYDRSRFLSQFRELQARGIEFVVASGNQFYQLISFFPEIKDDISFVAENGALVYEHGKEIFHGELTRHEYQIVLGELLKSEGLNFVACGLESAYVSKSAPPEFVELMSHHYHRLKQVDDYREIDDKMFKFSLNLPDSEIPQLVDALHVSLDGIMKPVTSGFGFVDLIIPGCSSAGSFRPATALPSATAATTLRCCAWRNSLLRWVTLARPSKPLPTSRPTITTSRAR